MTLKLYRDSVFSQIKNEAKEKKIGAKITSKTFN